MHSPRVSTGTTCQKTFDQHILHHIEAFMIYNLVSNNLILPGGMSNLKLFPSGARKIKLQTISKPLKLIIPSVQLHSCRQKDARIARRKGQKGKLSKTSTPEPNQNFFQKHSLPPSPLGAVVNGAESAT
jgi:hypothetical protein